MLIPSILKNAYSSYVLATPPRRDAFTILYAFYYPRSFYIPILMQVISLLSYTPFLLKTTYVDLRYVAVLVLVLAVIAWVKLARSAFRSAEVIAPAPT